ncbi:MAG: peptide chain release factor N(5)-glutamine methyltransferase [Rhodobacteraceae bacterium]|nr:peptide chain release factor N(5)-glutamine methyltransferase [Paracoccaceae bacterium]
MRAADALRAAVLRLKLVLGEGAARDARLLLAGAVGVDVGRLTLVLPDEISPESLVVFEKFVQQRMNRQPISQILGKRMFWGREFEVSGDVLDPRPETETLIDLALQGGQPNRILELGLGTGCILLTLLCELKSSLGFGVDISDAALAVAKRNARALGVEKRASLWRSDWFSTVQGHFDLIVSNPPYITAEEMAELEPEVANWEPALALTPGTDGLGAYRHIAAGLDRALAPQARALLEIGRYQAGEVCTIFQAAGFGRLEVYQDLNGFDRVIEVKR